MTESRRSQSPTGRLIGEYKVPTPNVSSMAIQASLYAQAMAESRQTRKMKALATEYIFNSEALVEAEEALMRHYAPMDTAYTLQWWRRYYGGEPMLINKLRAKDNQIVYLSDMIHEETVVAMTRPLRQPVWPSMRAVYSRICVCGMPKCVCPPWVRPHHRRPS